MCGIAGAIGEFDTSVLYDMMECLSHRGPDDQGQLIDEEAEVMMGIRRLSIIDIEGGAQPISNEDGTVSVVFNGEIYNHHDLRADLQEKGHRFSTESDTEALVHLWEEYGERMPEHLNGMFALSIWDARQDTLFIARDRLGIKPLYYTRTPSGLVWASELPAILEAGIERNISKRAVYNYFSLHYSPWPDTLIEGVKKLPPGTSLLVSPERMSLDRYWQLSSEPVSGSRGTIANCVRELLERSVERRLMADVPVGAFLSGGLDSSTVVALMSKYRDEPIKTFSVRFESEADESSEARFVANHFGTDHHEILVDPDSMDIFGDLVSHYGEPLPDPAVLPTMILSQKARENVKVVLTGSGADELFAGYWMHRTIPRHRRWARRVPKPLFEIADFAANVSPAASHYARYIASLESDRRAVVDAARRFRPLSADTYLDTDLDAETSGIYDRVDTAFSYAAKDDFFQRLSAFYLTYWLPDDILYKVDHATMSASLEARVPFLDHTLVEYAYNIPSRFQIEGGNYKPVLKRAVSDLVPSRILERSKQGFGIQRGEWLRTDHDTVVKWLSEDALVSVPYLDADRVQSIWTSHRKGTRNHGITLWKVLNYVAWYHTFGTAE